MRGGLGRGSAMNESPTRQSDEAIEAEIARLVDAEIFDERGQDRELKAIADRFAGRYLEDVSAWSEAMVDAPYAKAWDDRKFMDLIREGKDAELGALFRQLVTNQFSGNMFSKAEQEWHS